MLNQLKKVVLVFILTNSVVTFANEIANEKMFFKFGQALSKSRPLFPCSGSSEVCRKEQVIWLDAFEEIKLNQPELFSDLGKQIEPQLSEIGFDWAMEMRFRALINEGEGVLSEDLLAPLLDRADRFQKLAVCSLFKNKKALSPIWNCSESDKTYVLPSENSIRDLINKEPRLDQYKQGTYKNKARVYMFCRANRIYPCLQLIKRPDGKWHRNTNGSIWSQSALGYSRHFKEFNEFSGNTPSGVLEINGVMPQADQKASFGKFRRLILEFVSPGADEDQHKMLLPDSSHDLHWWRQAVIARDMGRANLRIHGTGHISPDAAKPYFPFFPTSGCIAKRENTYSGITYKDQRMMLNAMMAANNLEVAEKNETKIKGLIYIFGIDNESRPVQIKDLARFGIAN